MLTTNCNFFVAVISTVVVAVTKVVYIQTLIAVWTVVTIDRTGTVSCVQDMFVT